MYPAWLLDGLEIPAGPIEEQLRAAQDLVPATLIEDRGAAEELRQCESLSFYHLWMSTLCQIGWYAEEHDRDEELPTEFWLRAAQAAHAMSYPEMVPYALGKAKRLPRRGIPDLMAAFATMPATFDPQPGADFADPAELCDRAADVLASADPVIEPLIDAGDLAALAARLHKHGIPDVASATLEELFAEAFDGLFATVTHPDFPAEHADHAWAVINTNPFQVVLNDGLLITTRAVVWWRTD